MKNKFTIFIGLILFIGVFLFFIKNRFNEKKNLISKNNRLNIVCTTSIIGQTTKEIVKDLADVKVLMGPGIDPHLYKAKPSDIFDIENANIILYNGLHLEGKMVDILEGLSERGKYAFAVSNKIDKNILRKTEYDEIYDPHIWFDLSIWKNVAENIYKIIIEQNSVLFNEDEKKKIKENYNNFVKKIEEIDLWIYKKIDEIPEKSRILITAHDAFGYFGKRYGMIVEGLQGISTDAEVKISDIERIVEIIVKNEVKTIFVEQTISEKSLQGIQDLAKRYDRKVEISEQKLYSDALGEEEAETYFDMVIHNVNTIVKGLA